MADIFDELDQDLRDERARARTRRYGGIGGAVVVLALVAVGGWQGWEWWQGYRAQQAAAPFIAAMQAADALPPGPDPARLTSAEAFARVAADAPPGYRTLAQLREAALRWDAGDTQAALALWDRVGADSAVDPLLRDLGTLLWAQHAVDRADPAAVTAHTARLQAPGNAWRPLATEVEAELALRQDDRPKAMTLLRGLLVDPLATDELRQRVAGLLTVLGADPAANG